MTTVPKYNLDFSNINREYAAHYSKEFRLPDGKTSPVNARTPIND